MADLTVHEIVVFDNHQIEEVAQGYVRVSTVVTEKALNVYGKAHGGFLFTLCDQISGLTVMSTGFDAVTLQSSINYIKAGHCGQRLVIEGKISHDGRTTKVVDVTITNDKEQLIARGTFTMFVTGKRPE